MRSVPLPEPDGSFNVTRQCLPGEVEVLHPSTLIVHYIVQFDVLDTQGQLVASRTKQKQLRLMFQSLDESTDVDSLADCLIASYDVLIDMRKSQLTSSLNTLRGHSARPTSTTHPEPSRRIATPRAESAPVFSRLQPNGEVDDLLHDAPQRIHWGSERDCLETLTRLSELSRLNRNLALIVQHEPLMNTLVNCLKTFAVSSLPACIRIASIFERMSYFPHFIEVLQRFKIGAMTLSLLHAQVALKNVADQNLGKEKLAAYLKSQNHLLSLVVSMLFNLSENPSAMRKMVNKDIVTALVAVLERRNAELLILSLRFLRKITMVPVNWSAVPYDQICDVLAAQIAKWGQADAQNGRHKRMIAVREAIELLYAFSFHPEATDCIRESGAIVEAAKLSGADELNCPLIKLLFRCAGDSEEVFRNEELINMLILATTKEWQERILALMILSKFSLDRIISMQIARSPLFTTERLRQMFVDATTVQSEANQILLQPIRNVADNQPDLIRGFDEDIIAACARNSDRRDTLTNILAIANRAKMNSERAQFFANQKPFPALIVSILSGAETPPQLLLECIMVVAALVVYSAAAQVFQKLGVVDALAAVFSQYSGELDIQAQCMFAFYRAVCHSETRAKLLGRPAVIKAILKHSASKNAVLNAIAHSVIDAIVTFDPKSARALRAPRFDTFNQEWIQAIEALAG
jgi:hypothetical protein